MSAVTVDTLACSKILEKATRRSLFTLFLKGVDLTRDKFAYAADDFMQAVGEDNIFMSGFNWLAGTGTKEEKRKYVRFQIDEILCQIFNMQTEIMQPRNLKIVNKVKKEYLIRLDHQ